VRGADAFAQSWTELLGRIDAKVAEVIATTAG
jgi:hypothetical protein